MEKNKSGWLFVLPWNIEELGGVNRVVLELCKTMKDDGIYQPHILVLDWNARNPIVTDCGDYTEIRYRLRGISCGGSRSFRNTLMALIALPLTLLQLRKIFKNYSIKVLNYHYPTCAIFSLAFYRKIFSSPRLIVSLHGSDIINIGKKKNTGRIFWSTIFHTADAVVSCSHGLKKYYDSIFQGSLDTSIAIPNGLPDFFLNQTEVTDTGIVKELLGKKYILSVGAFLKIKGQDILIDAFKILADNNKDVDLVLVGREGDLLKECKKKTTMYGLASRIHFILGVEHKSLRAFYKNAFMYVSSSRFESFSLCILEAAACNLPVVATSTVGSNELIVNGYDGIIVPNENRNALAEGILEYLDKHKKKDVFSERFNKKIVSTYTWEKALKQYKEIIHNNVSIKGY